MTQRLDRTVIEGWVAAARRFLPSFVGYRSVPRGPTGASYVLFDFATPPPVGTRLAVWGLARMWQAYPGASKAYLPWPDPLIIDWVASTGDIALRLSIQPSDGWLTANSCISGAWGTEVRIDPLRLPTAEGAAGEPLIAFTVQADAIEIEVADSQLLSGHPVALEQVSEVRSSLPLNAMTTSPHWEFAHLQSPRARHPLIARVGGSDVSNFYQIFELQEFAVLDDQTDVGLVIDCGAYVGYSAAYFLSTFPECHVIAVEPNPANQILLRRNLAAYGDRVEIVEGAVWSHPATLVMSATAYRDGEMWAGQVGQCAAADGEKEVAGVDIGTLVKESDFDEISILKVDVEGAECVIFGSNTESWLPRVETLAIELHDDSKFGSASASVYRATSGLPFRVEASGERRIFRRDTTDSGSFAVPGASLTVSQTGGPIASYGPYSAVVSWEVSNEVAMPISIRVAEEWPKLFAVESARKGQKDTEDWVVERLPFELFDADGRLVARTQAPSPRIQESG